LIDEVLRYLADVEGEHNLVYNSVAQLFLPEDLP
jgi:hypothetical protein